MKKAITPERVTATSNGNDTPVSGGLVVANEKPLTMSSRAIAELTGKQHVHVKRDIKSMCDELEIDVSKFGCIFFDSMNRPQTEYLLDEELTLCLTSGYSVKQRMVIIQRWKQLEKAKIPVLQMSLPEALRLAADQAEALEGQKGQVKQLQQLSHDLSTQFVDGLTIPEFCKQLNGVNTQDVQNLLADKGILIRTAKGFSPNGYNRDRYFVSRPYTYSFGKSANKVLVTKKGAKYLYGLYHNGDLPMKAAWDGVYSHSLITE